MIHRPGMRVLFVTQYWPPETGAAPARALHFARALTRAGHEVRVITGVPNHPSGRIAPEYARAPRRTERLDGITVERVPLFATPRKTPWTRLWNHLTFAWSALGPALAGPPPDVVLASVPPLFLGVTAWIAARRHRAAFVIDCRDDWPAAAIALGEMRPGRAAQALEAVSSFLYRRASCLIAVTPGMRRQMERRGIEAACLELITNGADTDLFHPGNGNGDGGGHAGNGGIVHGAGNGAAGNAHGRLTVLYAGTHGLVHGMEVLLDAAERLRGEDVKFVLVGEGVAKAQLERRATEAHLDSIEFRPSVPPRELADLIRSVDVCVATTRAHEFCGDTIPVKLFDYLACGRPVVAAVSGDAAQVVEESGGGVVVRPGDGASLASVLAGLAADPARRAALAGAGPRYVEEHYSRRALGAKLVNVLEGVHRRVKGRSVTPLPHGLYGAAKRALDVLVAGALLVLFAPLLLAIALAIRIDSPGPALFRQRRIGRGTSEFTIFKFRTMRVGTPDLASHLMGPASPQVTRVGRFLRRTSLDELPQLFNVLAGAMTLVGPRPALHNQDDLIALRQQMGIDALKPGVTGWAQIHGRDDLPIPVKVAHERWYLEHLSPWLDVWIVLRTPIALFSSRGVY